MDPLPNGLANDNSAKQLCSTKRPAVGAAQRPMCFDHVPCGDLMFDPQIEVVEDVAIATDTLFEAVGPVPWSGLYGSWLTYCEAYNSSAVAQFALFIFRRTADGRATCSRRYPSRTLLSSHETKDAVVNGAAGRVQAGTTGTLSYQCPGRCACQGWRYACDDYGSSHSLGGSVYHTTHRCLGRSRGSSGAPEQLVVCHVPTTIAPARRSSRSLAGALTRRRDAVCW
jgi:hypothetical protein